MRASERNAVADEGDSYAHAYLLWWDYHQKFHSPLNLFHANIFFPYRYTLAFSEHHYGIALFCFPLFALGGMGGFPLNAPVFAIAPTSFTQTPGLDVQRILQPSLVGQSQRHLYG